MAAVNTKVEKTTSEEQKRNIRIALAILIYGTLAIAGWYALFGLDEKDTGYTSSSAVERSNEVERDKRYLEEISRLTLKSSGYAKASRDWATRNGVIVYSVNTSIIFPGEARTLAKILCQNVPLSTRAYISVYTLNAKNPAAQCRAERDR